MKNYDNAMRRQVYSLPELLREQYKDLEPKTRSILSFEEIFQIQRIVLTGCGDSHAAAMAVKYTFEQLTGITTEVVPAIELSRYYANKHLGFAPNNPLVLAVSNSGSVVRVGEAIQRAVKAGAFAIGFTGKEESLLGKSVSRIVPLHVPKTESAPGVRSYLVCVLSLLLLAIRIGEVRGKYTMDQAKAYRKSLLKQADLLEEMLPKMDEDIFEIAKVWKDFNVFDFTAAGIDYASAWYGHAKIIEATGKTGTCINAEEWLHLNFFQRDVAHIGTVVVCSSKNRGLKRVQEMVLHAARDMKRPTVVITDEPSLFEESQPMVVQVPASEYEFAGALTSFVPTALLAGYISALIGETYGRGCKDNWAFADHGAGINCSEIVLD